MYLRGEKAKEPWRLAYVRMPGCSRTNNNTPATKQNNRTSTIQQSIPSTTSNMTNDEEGILDVWNEVPKMEFQSNPSLEKGRNCPCRILSSSLVY
jgi:hypothetical protein